jgi:hypothetical protein
VLENIHLAALERKRGVRALPAALPTSLRHLALSACTFASAAGLVGLLSAGPGLRSLSIEFCEWSALTAAPEDAAYAPTLELEDFRLVLPPRETEVGRPWLSIVSARRLVTLEVTLSGAKDILF